MWVDRDGWAHVEDQYDPTTWAEHPDNREDVDWPATRTYRERQTDDTDVSRRTFEKEVQ